MEEKSHLLQAENLHVKKAKKPVIRGISLEIKAGEWLAVTGPSGSGKSALLSLLSGKGRPSKGSISLNGREVRPHQLRRETALVSQQPLFWDSFYLELQFILGLRLQGVPEKEAARRVREALNDAELSFAGRMFPSHLSRGQLLQAAFARVLMRRSRILLLDDPFSAM
ncbi:MAG: ATP-binding cassette domain-containing protein, partial [Clostridiales bacterium]|nr:ATP-binding cassette domain-containing protein [Clostridiales bacterium]